MTDTPLDPADDADDPRDAGLHDLTDRQWLDAHVDLINQARDAGDHELVAELAAFTWAPYDQARALAELEAARR